VLNVRSQILVEGVRAKRNTAFHTGNKPGIGRGYDDEHDDEQDAEENVEDDIEDEIELDAPRSSSCRNISTINPKTNRDPLYEGILLISIARLVEANCLQSIVFTSQQTLRREEWVTPIPTIYIAIKSARLIQPILKIFKILWSEPLGSTDKGGDKDSIGTEVVYIQDAKHGERAYLTIRRFVIVMAKEGHCVCV
jgi:hypothetical protein